MIKLFDKHIEELSPSKHGDRPCDPQFNNQTA